MYETFPSGRRLDELNPGEYKGTKNSQKPVVVEGHWEEPTPEEQQKHDTVHKLQVWPYTIMCFAGNLTLFLKR